MADQRARPEGIAGSPHAGPFPVGAYAAKLRDELRKRARVQLFGEVFGLRVGRARVWFELRDAEGAVPCSMWRDAFEELRLPAGALSDGGQVVVAGGPDYYRGLAHRLAVVLLRRQRPAARGRGRPARPGRGPAPHARRRGAVRAPEAPGAARRCRAASAWSPARAARRATTCSPACAAAAGRGASCGPSPPSRTATPRRPSRARCRTWPPCEEVEVVVVARGGGSLADLFAFCDETLCRTVALLRVPVIASVGHHTDRTLIDDVAAVSCSTPTHAAETAVPLHCGEARAAVAARAGRLAVHARRAVIERARHLAHLSRAPGEHVARERGALHQKLREARASATRRVRDERAATRARASALARRATAAAGHYVDDQPAFVRACESHMTAPGRFLIVEYETNDANRWVPHPVPQDRLIALFGAAGYALSGSCGRGRPCIGAPQSTPRWRPALSFFRRKRRAMMATMVTRATWSGRSTRHCCWEQTSGISGNRRPKSTNLRTLPRSPRA